MPVQANVSNLKLQLMYNYGVDDKGNVITKSKTYSNINNTVTDQVKYDVAVAIAALQAHALEGVHVIQDNLLLNV
ncbi:uncharacterized protein DUF1659 [Alkalibaculum bacchi]|uniref:Uncharacterized protein DUF1659 n=1 Tax=Alkalibaculum bacchi TaxID=645887 RepID=A0A366HX24_9FIRM|nr:DUF1659 domain-containing protein [Alkalibaculum bacchi]RBP58069.1 uncharacterized protein DUF1659 [Alkalibaculum bacchi]